MPIKTVDGWKTKAQIARQEKAWKKARRHLVEKLGEANLTNETLIKQRALEVFADIDMDKNKSIDSAELKEAMKQMGVELKNKEIEDMMIEADADGDGQINQEEFQDLCCVEVRHYRAATKSAACALM